MKSTVLFLAIFSGFGLAQPAPSGEDVFKNRCALCHDNESAHAPAKTALKTMTPARIINTLDFGIMMSVTSMLSRVERDAVANYLGTPRRRQQDLNQGIPVQGPRGQHRERSKGALLERLESVSLQPPAFSSRLGIDAGSRR